MEKQKKIPLLRFPQFKEEWQLKKFGSLVNRISDPVNVDDEKLYKQIGIRSHGKGLFYKDAVTGKSLGDKRVFWIKEDTFVVNIVFAWEQAVAKTTVKEIGMIASHRFPMYLPINTKSNLDYLVHFFLTKKGKFLLELASPGGAGRNKTLGQKEFENLKFHIPSSEEQIKIASFLTALDNKLTQLKQKKSLLDQYKKGIMQKIFSQEIRFKDDDGKAFPEWEKKKLGELYSFISTNSFSRENLNYENGEVKNIHYGDIHTKFKVQFDITKELVPYINPEIQLRITENNYCREGDLIIADASEDYADVGKSIEIMNLNHEKTVAGLHTILARPDLSILAIGFGGFLMKSHAVRNQIMIISQGTKVLSISTGRLAVIKIELPIKAEQTKIANFLSAIDEKINHCQLQIEKTVLYKKGLLQKMFC